MHKIGKAVYFLKVNRFIYLQQVIIYNMVMNTKTSSPSSFYKYSRLIATLAVLVAKSVIVWSIYNKANGIVVDETVPTIIFVGVVVALLVHLVAIIQRSWSLA